MQDNGNDDPVHIPITGELDLQAIRDRLLQECQAEIAVLSEKYGTSAVELLANEAITEINYPVLEYPEKVKPLNLDKTPEVEGILQGIKGQYLILDVGVINIRKYTGYQLEFDGL